MDDSSIKLGLDMFYPVYTDSEKGNGHSF